jgi:hypothetical protein
LTPLSNLNDFDEFTMVSYGKKKKCSKAGARTLLTAITDTKGLTIGATNIVARKLDSPIPTATKTTAVTIRSPVATRAQATTTSTNTALVTLATFAAFHQQVYPIIEKIVGTGRQFYACTRAVGLSSRIHTI